MPKQQRDREIKRAPQYIKMVDGRSVTGIFSTFGVRDSYNDIMQPGSFSKTFTERGGKILHLWQHDFWSPPTAVISELREVERDELPQKMQEEYPEATGGAEVERHYVESERGNEVLAAIRAGSPLQMSFAYDAIRSEILEEEDGAKMRLLHEVRLHEVSDVLWGANSATVASKVRPSIPIETLLGQLDAWLTGLKEIDQEKETFLKRINHIALLAHGLGASNVKLITDVEPEPDEPDEDPDPAVEGKGAANGDEEPSEGRRRAGVHEGPPLTLLKAKLELLTL